MPLLFLGVGGRHGYRMMARVEVVRFTSLWNVLVEWPW